TILFHDLTTDYAFKPGPRHTPAPTAAQYPIPAQKSLFGKRNERGLPIGNLTSQFWANVYLNDLDQFAKRQLMIRYYIRYVDDLVLLDTDADTLRRWRDATGAFVEQGDSSRSARQGRVRRRQNEAPKGEAHSLRSGSRGSRRTRSTAPSNSGSTTWPEIQAEMVGSHRMVAT